MLTANKEITQMFDNISESKEKFHWTGKPHFWSYLISTTGSAILALGLILLFIVAPFLFVGLVATLESSSATGLIFILIPLGTMFLFALPVLIAVLRFKKIAYAFTESRILISGGLVGIDYKMLEYSQIRNAEVTVGLMGKIFGVGSIHIYTGEHGINNLNRDVLISVQEPYQVFKELKGKIDSARKSKD